MSDTANQSGEGAARNRRATALALLAWYRDMGVDGAVADAAVDWTARGKMRPGAEFQWPHLDTQIPVTTTTGSVPSTVSSQRSVPRSVPRSGASVAPTPRVTDTVPTARVPTTRASDHLPREALQPSIRQFPTATPDDAVLSARAEAKAATSIEALRARLMVFEGCALKSTAKSLCVYRGATSAKLMLMGDAPTSDDDLKGAPFSGVEGQLLDRMLAAIGLEPMHVHIANCVYWRPPGNRRPTAVELAVCRPFLDRQIELVQPTHLVLLGEMALQHMLDTPDKIMKARGGWRSLRAGGHNVKVMPMLHPSYLLKAPASKRLAWLDLLALKASLEDGP
jgi:uracil-DNA glycosylase